jgi:hypothetical protein
MSASAGLVADRQLLQPPAAAAGPSCSPGTSTAGRISSILLCQGRAFVAAGDSAATASLQMWQGGSSSSSASWEGGCGSSGGDVPELLDVICIADCEWLGR